MERLTDLVKKYPLLVAAYLLFFAVYSGAIPGGFQRDDIPQIVDSLALEARPSAAGLFSPEYFSLYGSVAYRPAVALLRSVERSIFGLDPRLWRLFNLLLHAANALLLARILLRTTAMPAAASAGAALFLLHPVHTEALNYISNGQCDILCLFFLLLAFGSYLDGSAAAVAGWFLLALFSKEMALAFPLLLWLYDRWLGNTAGNRKLHAATWSLAAVFLLLRLTYLRPGPGFVDNFSAAGAFSVSLPAAFSAALRFPLLAGYYLKLLVWPAPLSVEIDRLLPESGFFSGLNMALAWAVAAAASAYAILRRKKGPAAFFPAAFALALLPVSGLVPLTSLVQEHFVYIPSVFFFAFLGVAFARAAAGRGRGVVFAAAAAVLALSAGRTWARNADWRTPLALAQSDLAAFPRSPAAMTGLAMMKAAAGERSAALELCGKAIKTGAGDGEAYFLAADIYLRDGDIAKAVEAAVAGLARGHGSPDSLVSAARIYARAGRLAEAEAAAREAARGFPYFEPAYSTLGEIFLLRGDHAKAREMFLQAVRLNSRSPSASRLEVPAGGR
jgi:tetratricopeptide (TPR) repeat protein